MNEYKLKTGKLENTVVNGYKKIEDGVVLGYKKIENAFVDTFLEKVEKTEEFDLNDTPCEKGAKR